MADKRLFFFARGPLDEPGAWARMADEAWVRDYLSESLKEAGVGPERAFSRLRVERHYSADSADTRVYVWGEDEPGVQLNDYGDHTGLKVELDGQLVYTSLEPSGDGDLLEAHDEDCEECAASRAFKEGRG